MKDSLVTRPSSSLDGPYHTEAEAAATPMVRAWRAHFNARVRPGESQTGDPGNLSRECAFGFVERVCADAGVELGAFDQSTLWWLAGGEKPALQVVIGLVARAARRDVAGLDAAAMFAAMGLALRWRANTSPSDSEVEMLKAIAWAFELVAEGLGGDRARLSGEACTTNFDQSRGSIGCGGQGCAYCRPSTELDEVLAPLVQSLHALGLARRSGT